MSGALPADLFDSAYQHRSAPWVIGEPQPEVVALERAGAITGTVLDPGCGTGEHTIHLARLGYDVVGFDFAPRAVELARANAAEKGVEARFEVADAFALAESGRRVDTVVDSALFHVFSDPDDRAEYVRNLHAVCRPGGVVHVLALSDAEPGFGPRISDSVIRDAFGEGWELEELRPARYRCIAIEGVADSLGLTPGEPVDQAAWLARVRRV
ncbi:class I SAM-dependent methyltransferase [Streptomonospora nanhaiensis]|uniref:SAM-dependent methyltransferase n=1 Tax=Streptomonospora nanhaiensis TaxID=1323731 RepID=A0A853BQU1_9ACTN|nr:class I SAM-dependent methyltransferase [Streptomonospora nanhaiensis]NYI96927.1 SAM-dependent methyltransferase [Streptomonospora nanhaiensis]